jgi:UPF0042 nucleotide-binding protein
MSGEEQRPEQHAVIVSGLSGAGKTTVLKALEDMGYHCVDNLPVALVRKFARHIRSQPDLYHKVALGMDARAAGMNLADSPAVLEELNSSGLRCQVLFLTADDAALVKRFAETRRRHPLATGEGTLQTAIEREREVMEPLRRCADWELDTSRINIHELTHETWKCVGPDSADMTVVLQSFGFSKGVPRDADFLFDVRSLPNPHWSEDLRPLTGRDGEVAAWLEQEPLVNALAGDIRAFLESWLPELEKTHRRFVTIGIGCTGGRHRSVYMAERLAPELRRRFGQVMVHHRELGPR